MLVEMKLDRDWVIGRLASAAQIMLVTSDSKGMSILPTLREFTHMFGILPAPSGSAAIVATMV
jgi:hypothetical protein